MKCIIASNRQLPIRYYVNQQCFIKRGISSPIEITLPFFVEVELFGDYSIIAEYIQEIKSQYTQCDIQIYSKETDLLEWLSGKHTVKFIQTQFIIIN